jgi:UDPglucose--hexose-1-phosphate uridylyltransferase
VGREDRTPPESYAIARSPRDPDTPGWQVRVVPNLYPALERQEVVVHSPRHVRSIAELDESELPPIASAWNARIEAAREQGFGHVQLLLNEGRAAGASLPHSHSQLAWLRKPPPVARAEAPRLAGVTCALCALLAGDDLEVAFDHELSLRAAIAGRVPYELLIAPLGHEDRPSRDELEAALRLLRESILRLRALEGPLPLNAWLHSGAHWHFELVPRLTILAGLELGAGLYVNWLAPEEAAARLRAASSPSSG